MKLFDWLKGKQKSYKPSWERIGQDCVVSNGAQLDNVPEWVLKELERLHKKYSWHDSVTEGRYFVVKGKHYRYRITPVGQGGSITYIDRKLRRKYWNTYKPERSDKTKTPTSTSDEIFK